MDSTFAAWLLGIAVGVAGGSVGTLTLMMVVNSIKGPGYKREMKRRKMKKIRDAVLMLSEGLSVAHIKAHTGLTEAEIDEVLKS